MGKTLSRDIQLLTKMLINITDAMSVVQRYSVTLDTNAKNSMHLNKDAFDLCSFYMAQAGEKVKLLSDSTFNFLQKEVDLGTLKYFRNKIDHDYESVSKAMLQAYMSKIINKNTIRIFKERIQYCQNNKK